MKRGMLAAALVLVLIACAGREQKEEASLKPYLSQMQRERYDSLPDTLARRLADFAIQYPKNPNSPDYLFAAAGLFERQGKWYRSAELFEKFSQLFPQHPRLERALLAGAHNFVESGNTRKGKALYETFLQKFPNSKLAEDVRLLLPDIELTPEQLLEKVLQRARQDSLKKAEARP
ncbi:MAG: tetratricopeptide repeat protein [Bacteroidetes bacterium]|nr:tetratricopeptide repeat protein [Bacteroidota bacterium]